MREPAGVTRERSTTPLTVHRSTRCFRLGPQQPAARLREAAPCGHLSLALHFAKLVGALECRSARLCGECHCRGGGAPAGRGAPRIACASRGSACRRRRRDSFHPSHVGAGGATARSIVVCRRCCCRPSLPATAPNPSVGTLSSCGYVHYPIPVLAHFRAVDTFITQLYTRLGLLRRGQGSSRKTRARETKISEKTWRRILFI
jgi:hypothetical protein